MPRDSGRKQSVSVPPPQRPALTERQLRTAQAAVGGERADHIRTYGDQTRTYGDDTHVRMVITHVLMVMIHTQVW